MRHFRYLLPLSVAAGLLVAPLPIWAQQNPPLAPVAQATNKTEHVVMIVWDGLRPDSVTAQNTPTLFKMGQQGVVFSRHHPVYPSSTEVNGTALATGVYPENSTIIGNREYRPAIDPLKSIATEDLKAVRKGDTGGSYIAVATVAETLQKAGNPTAVAGTKPVALLADRSEKKETPASQASANIFEGKAIPTAELEETEQSLGAFPETITFPNTKQDTWTTDALTKVLWKQEVPKFSVLWLSDVDFTQHDTAPGSPTALGALKSCDDRLATVLATLDAKGVRNKTTVFVVSDHGFSTINRQLDMNQLLQDAGFQAPKEFTAPPKRGEIMVVGLSGSAYLYVGEHDPDTTQRLVKFLQKSDFAGVIFSRDGLPGTFSLSQGHINSPAAPDVAVSFRWADDKNPFGISGSIVAEGKRKAGQGSHATLSRYDMHNTLIAAGPDFKNGYVDQIPSGNVDLAPTILYLLGTPSLNPMNGRVFTEALKSNAAPLPAIESGQWEATRLIDGKPRSQYLAWSLVGNTMYFDEGNNGTMPLAK